MPHWLTDLPLLPPDEDGARQGLAEGVGSSFLVLYDDDAVELAHLSDAKEATGDEPVLPEVFEHRGVVSHLGDANPLTGLRLAQGKESSGAKLPSAAGMGRRGGPG